MLHVQDKMEGEAKTDGGEGRIISYFKIPFVVVAIYQKDMLFILNISV